MSINTGRLSVLTHCCHRNAENPLWHPEHQLLYWTDIPTGRMFRCNPKSNSYEQIYQGEPVGGFTIQADGTLLLFKTKGTIEIWDEGKTTVVVPEIEEAKDTRFNDAIADPEGRVFSGTMATDKAEGKLYRIDTDGSVHVVATNFLIPNGMGFCNDYQYFYLTDSDRRTIYRFNYDRATGNLTDQTPYIVTSETEGVPDGMTIDTEGYFWSARWDGGHVYRYSPEGEEVHRLQIPTAKVSCVTFGGPDYNQLFISTAGGDANTDSEDQGSKKDKLAGNIFHIQVDVTGRPELRSRIKLD